MLDNADLVCPIETYDDMQLKLTYGSSNSKWVAKKGQGKFAFKCYT